MAKNGTLAKSQDLQPSFQTEPEQITIGIDLGDRFSHCLVLGPDGKVLTEGRLRSTPETMARHFQDLPPSRIAIEVRTHSRWVSQLLSCSSLNRKSKFSEKAGRSSLDLVL